MSEDAEDRAAHDDLLRMAVDIVAAFVSGNEIPAGQIPEAIRLVFSTLSSLGEGNAAVAVASVEAQKPAVPVRRSVQPDHIVCLEDGKKLKMLKRHLRTNYGMSPDEYRAKWGLAADYPMVAPNYAAQR
ncbi:MAG: MucR family transcriptional regulator, partial [Alphaproteobacteria bacterium]|nr:MucR family transcriptional regulator [Alphaproteobacteria bacterium]